MLITLNNTVHKRRVNISPHLSDLLFIPSSSHASSVSLIISQPVPRFALILHFHNTPLLSSTTTDGVAGFEVYWRSRIHERL